MNILTPSELVLNSDGSIYHLHCHPDDVADTIILVGDPARVPRVSQYFDRIDVIRQHREFLTHTGWIGTKRLTVISTGIGVGGIDIVINELDACANIDFVTRTVKPQLRQLTFCRMGTCGGLSPILSCGDFIFSQLAASFDGLMSFYSATQTAREPAFQAALINHFGEALGQLVSVSAAADDWALPPAVFKSGLTLTCSGFYGPQGRQLRLPLSMPTFFERVQSFQYDGLCFFNFEMETAVILGLARALGHRAASLSVVLADRVQQTFAEEIDVKIDALIQSGLSLLVE